MLTSTLESFTVGHTILISRGLLDLPDEGSLAMVLAHELGHILSAHTLADRWAVRDWSVLLVEDHFDHFDFPIDAPVEQAANAKTVQLLNGSPTSKLGNSVQFLQMLSTQAQSLPSLISPHLISEVPLANLLVTVAHSIPASKEQSISALPMGLRIDLNPWTSQVDLQKSKPRALVSSQKRQPLLINPSIPHLVLQSTEGPEQQGKSVLTDSSQQKN